MLYINIWYYTILYVALYSICCIYKQLESLLLLLQVGSSFILEISLMKPTKVRLLYELNIELMACGHAKKKKILQRDTESQWGS